MKRKVFTIGVAVLLMGAVIVGVTGGPVVEDPKSSFDCNLSTEQQGVLVSEYKNGTVKLNMPQVLTGVSTINYSTYVKKPGWAVIPKDNLDQEVATTNPCLKNPEYKPGKEFNGTVYTGPNFVYIYENQTGMNITKFETHGATVRIYEPGNTNLPEFGRESVIKSYAYARSQLSTNKDEITVFVTPEKYGAYGMHWSSGEDGSLIWVADSIVANLNTSSVWVHEYVHSQQEFGTDEHLTWFVEGSAEYLSTKYSINSHSVSNESAYYALKSHDYYTGTLYEPESWEYDEIAYFEGELVAMYMDYSLQQNNSSLEEMIYWMNEQEGEVSYAEFRDEFEKRTSTETAEMLDKYVKTQASPEIKTEHLQTQPGSRVPLSELLSDNTTMETFDNSTK